MQEPKTCKALFKKLTGKLFSPPETSFPAAAAAERACYFL